ncbi:Double-strand break repair protein MRE11 [Camellia lanceoleosa]|nr:Double-strand break repair protein MRE11 [Camellia lanceoleosa]
MADSSRDDFGNTLRVLVATDCHLGYMEKDEIVDFLLLGGDLFHENKPSRSTLVKAIEILVVIVLAIDRCSSKFGHVNYEDPHFNVGLRCSDNLSAVDILSACNLVNYFGKMVLGGSGVGQITVYPILIRKGSTSVALYGLGNIRDERLNRMFQAPHAVQWMRPEAQEGCQVTDWFNILVLHQNSIFCQFMDFIVWGHEHECLIDPQEVPGMGFHITQPATSLFIYCKSFLYRNQYRPTKIPLNSVRPFEYTESKSSDESDIDPNDQNSILEHLDKVPKGTNSSEVKLPLVRVKVDYSGFMTINPQRFEQKYVANPQDILIFSKASRKGQSERYFQCSQLSKFNDSERLLPEELNQQNIEALVAENNLKMEILPVNDLDVALHNFVNKNDKMAFYSCLQYNLEETHYFSALQNKIARDADTLKICISCCNISSKYKLMMRIMWILVQVMKQRKNALDEVNDSSVSCISLCLL